MEENPLTFAGGVNLCNILALPQFRITHLDLSGAMVTDVAVPYPAEALKSHRCPIITSAWILSLAIKLSVNKALYVPRARMKLYRRYGCLGVESGTRLYMDRHCSNFTTTLTIPDLQQQ
ncbi:MAG: hypothetical protein J3R72DRAFT_485821 [Linnemannia gamsii]|nr:MAG: hypothetical protein J3R72DRAFT_485821 [Linnemannia gamsii]